MSNKSEKYIKNAVLSEPTIKTLPSNAPPQLDDLQYTYLADRAKIFTAERAQYACDYVKALVQGLTPDFYAYTETYLRLCDIASMSAAGTKNEDDYKLILFTELGIDYFPIGAKVQTMGNTWICINPGNMSTALADALIARCNASYNSYDYYGNVITEPLVVEKMAMLGNDNEQGQNLVLMDGYFNVTCQLNEVTAQLGRNKRLILGTNAYHITGYTDFIQEFTGDRESVHLLKFTARLEEPTINDDITKNFIADGNVYTFEAKMSGASDVRVGQTTTLTPKFIKNGEEVASTAEHPVSWKFASSNESIATVDDDGNVTGTGEGSVTITAVLAQNPSVYATFEMNVADEGNNFIAFSALSSKEIRQYTADVFTAFYYENGVKTNEPLDWAFWNAPKDDYTAVVDDDGLSVNVYCISPSATPLVITATHGGHTASITVELVGY